MTATLENLRSYRGLTNDQLKARLDAAGTGFPTATMPKRRPAMSDPTPTPDRVTEARRAEIRERLGRGGNGMVSNTPTPRRVDTANPDRPGRVDDGEPMRDRQRGLVMVLLERELRPINPAAADAGKRWFEAQAPTMTKAKCSDWITRIRAMIAAGPVAVSGPIDHDEVACAEQFGDCVCIPMPSVPATPAPTPRADVWAAWREIAARVTAVGGRYGARFAVPTEDGATNALAFWWIAPGQDGRFWLRQVIGGSGPVRVRMNPEAMIALATKIEKLGALECMIRYGQELGECGHCGRDLTNDVSRAAGMGPKCRKGH